MSSSQKPFDHVLVTIPGVFLHLIQNDSSLQLASGDLTITTINEAESVVAVIARVGDQVQWPLTKDVSAVKLDESHYFFTLRVPNNNQKQGEEDYDVLSYGLTVASKGQEGVLKELDEALERYSILSVEKLENVLGWEVVAPRETSPEEMKISGEKRELVEESSAAYWTTVAPNVEDYSSRFARWIATGSGQVVRGILWCGDVTVERLKSGNDFFKRRMQPASSQSQISPRAMESVDGDVKESGHRVLSGVVKVPGFFTSSAVSSKAGKKFFSFLPGEVVFASMDGFNKVCDAVEVAGRNVMSTSSVVTTELVSHKYGEEAGKVINEGLDAAGHAMGTAWTVFKIWKELRSKI
ncbi:uncharacterized protein DS421_13g396850 [Arachis hypogaea]|nr:uncharacterized protein DS421_13g396850 [Arachis hypogaea]